MAAAVVRYFNLIMFQTDATTMEVVGEDTAVTDFSDMSINFRHNSGTTFDTQESTTYNNLLAATTTLKVTHTALTVLPPGTKFTNLATLDITGCSNIIQVPTDYGTHDGVNPGTLTTLLVSGTKLSSIPSTFNGLVRLDVSNCKRISSAGSATLETLLMSHSSITELVATGALKRLVALNTKITSIPSAPNLQVVMWSGGANATLAIVDATAIVHILTTGAVTAITGASASTEVTSITL